MTHSDKPGPPAQQILETEVNGEVALYDPKTESVTVLNGTAGDVWLLCDGNRTTDDICALLASSYEVPAEDIRADVTAAVHQLSESGLFAD